MSIFIRIKFNSIYFIFLRKNISCIFFLDCDKKKSSCASLLFKTYARRLTISLIFFNFYIVKSFRYLDSIISGAFKLLYSTYYLLLHVDAC